MRPSHACTPGARSLSWRFSCPQIVGSILFIFVYYRRRIVWRLKQRKGKKRIAAAARDALAIKKKNSDIYDVHVTGATLAQLPPSRLASPPLPPQMAESDRWWVPHARSPFMCPPLAGSVGTSVNGDRLGAGHGAVWLENAGYDLEDEGVSVLGSEDGSQPFSGRSAASSIRRHISM